MIAAKGRDFEIMSFHPRLNDAESLANGFCAADDTLNGARGSGRGDVIVLWFSAEKHVAHAAAGKICFKSGILQLTNNSGRALSG
jgi:hypothetical protein